MARVSSESVVCVAVIDVSEYLSSGTKTIKCHRYTSTAVWPVSQPHADSNGLRSALLISQCELLPLHGELQFTVFKDCEDCEMCFPLCFFATHTHTHSELGSHCIEEDLSSAAAPQDNSNIGS